MENIERVLHYTKEAGAHIHAQHIIYNTTLTPKQNRELIYIWGAYEIELMLRTHLLLILLLLLLMRPWPSLGQVRAPLAASQSLQWT